MKFSNQLIVAFFISITIQLNAQKVNYNESFKQGNLLVLEKNYTLALTFFQKAYSADSSSANINYKLGMCYLNTIDQKSRALYHLTKALININRNYNFDNPTEKKAPEETYKWMGIALRLEGKIEESDNYFAKFRDIVGTKNKEITDDLERQIEINSNYVSFSKNKTEFAPSNLGDSVNTPYQDYNPVISPDGKTLYFTSRNESTTGALKEENGNFFEDIYQAKIKKDFSWCKPTPFGFNVNSAENESVAGISPDGTQLFFNKDVNEGEIYYSTYDGTNWGSSLPMLGINSAASESGGSITADGKIFVFASDRKTASQGGMDIWMSNKQADGKWSPPVNLGLNINSKYDEINPYITPNGKTIYFASNGFNTMGGYDIFKSTSTETGVWGKAENLKAPINSADDEMFYSQTSDGKKVFFSAIRKEGKGSLDIYKLSYVKEVVELPSKNIKVNLAISSNGNLPNAIRAIIIDTAKNLRLIDTTINSFTKNFSLQYKQQNTKATNYILSIEANGFQPVNETISANEGADLYETDKFITITSKLPEKITPDLITFTGQITNKNGKPIAGAKIIVKDNVIETFINTFYVSADSGIFIFTLPSGQNYFLTFDADGYLYQSENISLPKQLKTLTIKRNIALEKIEVGTKVVLNNIFFDNGKASLRMESNLEIEKLVSLMKRYPFISVEVDGHTDNKGNEAANLLLSQNRAKSVIDEIMRNGVDSNRLKYKGFGSSQPKVPNTLPNGKPDIKGMQINRRVELLIIDVN
jgi:outer membrane protein OmpA-like peptidoglycan-associated protein